MSTHTMDEISCPLCKSKIKKKIPGISIILRNQIEKRFPDAYKRRKKEVDQMPTVIRPDNNLNQISQGK